MGRKSKIDKKVVIELYKNGMTYRAIAKKLDSNEDSIRMLIKRNAPDDLAKKREGIEVRKNTETNNELELELEHSNFLNVNDLKEIREEKSFGIMPNESIGDDAIKKLFWQSFKLNNKKNSYVFDESRGLLTHDMPKNYI